MTSFLILIQQILIMALFMAIGYLFFKKGFLTEQGSKDIMNLLIKLVLPLVMIKSFFTERTPEKTEILLVSFILAIVGLLISIVICCLIWGKRHVLENLAASFPNAGFIGIPLITAAISEEAVFYIAPYIVFVNILQWTYCPYLMTGDKTSIKPKKVLTNNMLIAGVIAVVVYFLNFDIPEVVLMPINMIASLNTPLAMIVVGTFLARGKLSEIFTTKVSYFTSFVRLVLIPLVTLAIFYFVPEKYAIATLAVLVITCAPIGSNISVIAEMFGGNSNLAAKEVCLCTILSMITMPFMILLINTVMPGLS